MIEDPVMNLKYLGRVSLTNSLLEEGDILLREGEMTERKSAPPPIQATIDPTWSTRSTMNNTSTITCLTLSPVRLLSIYDVAAGCKRFDSHLSDRLYLIFENSSLSLEE